jgi:hypothetical protein
MERKDLKGNVSGVGISTRVEMGVRMLRLDCFGVWSGISRIS